METIALYRIIALEYGYLNPEKYVQEMSYYYDAYNNWPSGKIESIMRYWMFRRTQMKPNEKPNLSETERVVLKAFIERIEQRLVVRLFHVLVSFEVTEKAIIFRVKAENKDKFAQWLTDIDAPHLLAAYNREVQVEWR